MKKLITRLSLVFLMVILALIVYAYSQTWGKAEIEFRIHINEQLVHESAFGESPTFAIWLEDHNTGKLRTVFATRRAAEGDWEGKAEVPVALPGWDEVAQTERTNAPDGVSGATPEPGYFILRVPVDPGDELTAWIEVNLAGDFNDFYMEFDEVEMKEDEYRSGQPALLYKAEVEVLLDFEAMHELCCMSILDSEGNALLEPLQGITTATEIFDEISVRVQRPKPRILKKSNINF